MRFGVNETKVSFFVSSKKMKQDGPRLGLALWSLVCAKETNVLIFQNSPTKLIHHRTFSPMYVTRPYLKSKGIFLRYPKEYKSTLKISFSNYIAREYLMDTVLYD